MFFFIHYVFIEDRKLQVQRKLQNTLLFQGITEDYISQQLQNKLIHDIGF